MSTKVSTKAVLIAGPTASGKSRVALALAQRLGGVVINTDSKQVYRDLRILSARPGEAEEAAVPHRFYGHVDAAVNYSVAAFLTDAEAALAEAARENLLPVFVGGTGLYFKALTVGLSKAPPVPADVRDAVRMRLAEKGPQTLHTELAARDPAVAARLMPADRARIARALEVIIATGRSIDEWNRDNAKPLLDPSATARVFLEPDRKDLYSRIDTRFDAMMAAGALDEVAALASRNLDPLLPAMKAHGVPSLIKQIRGEMSLPDAIYKGKLDTRHYAKRQFTWFRHQLADWGRATPETALEGLLRAILR